jgi:hypothetical protein
MTIYLPKRVKCDGCKMIFREPIHYRPIKMNSLSCGAYHEWKVNYCYECRMKKLAHCEWRRDEFYSQKIR